MFFTKNKANLRAKHRKHDQFGAVQGVVVLAGIHCIYIYIYPTDVFWVNKIFFKNNFRKISFSYQIPDQNTLT